MNTTKVLHCRCHSPEQDKMYGQGMRVHNLKQKDPKAGQWRCTVCEAINQHSLKEDEIKEVAGKDKTKQ